MWDFVGKSVENGADSFMWLLREMDTTQWGVASVIFVVMGFLALRTRM